MVDKIKVLSISLIAEIGTMKAYEMLVLLLVMLFDSRCIIEAGENDNDSYYDLDHSIDDGSGFEGGNDSGNSFIH